MHLALYRSERPENFDEMIGQKHIVKILRNQLKTNSVSQSYLFTGTRGTGKTTTARIIAKAVNCTANIPDEQKPCCQCENCKAIKEGNFIDVVELDAASNNGVDDLRAIIDSVQYPPAYGKYKVYIIDEVHMLSTSAENAFLKTLEEPPAYAIFILATTNPEKVRQTIRSRCMTLNFRRVSENDLVEGMGNICSKRGINITREALAAVATRADGSVRDGLSILEQCISGGDQLITLELVNEYLGSAGLDFYLDLTEQIITGNAAQALIAIDNLIREGKDSKQVIADWLQHFRDLMIARYIEDPSEIINASGENVIRIKEQAQKLDSKRLEYCIRLLSEYVNQTKYSAQPRILLETAAIQLLAGEQSAPVTYTSAPQANIGNLKQQMSQIQPANNQGKTAAYHAPQSPSHPADGTVGAQTQRNPASAISTHPASASDAGAMQPQQTPVAAATETAAIPAVNTEADIAWKRIVDELSQYDFSFKIMVGDNSKAYSFVDDELTVIIKKNKTAIANSKRELVDRVAKNLIGPSVRVTFRAGDINHIANAGAQQPESAAPRTVRQATAPHPQPSQNRQMQQPAQQESTAAQNRVVQDRTQHNTMPQVQPAQPESAATQSQNRENGSDSDYGNSNNLNMSPAEVDMPMDMYGDEQCDINFEDKPFYQDEAGYCDPVEMKEDKDSMIEELAGDVSSLLGIQVDIVD